MAARLGCGQMSGGGGGLAMGSPGAVTSGPQSSTLPPITSGLILRGLYGSARRLGGSTAAALPTPGGSGGKPRAGSGPALAGRMPQSMLAACSAEGLAPARLPQLPGAATGRGGGRRGRLPPPPRATAPLPITMAAAACWAACCCSRVRSSDSRSVTEAVGVMAFRLLPRPPGMGLLARLGKGLASCAGSGLAARLGNGLGLPSARPLAGGALAGRRPLVSDLL